MTPRALARLLAAALVLVLSAGLLSVVSSATAAPIRGGAAGASKKGFSVSWDTTTIYPGGRIAAHGKVPGAKRKVLLQVKVKSSWQTFGSDRTNKRGKFRVSGKLDWYGSHKVRVLAPGRKSYAKSKRVQVLTPYAPVGNKKDFNYINGSSVAQNYRFNPCQTIRYRLNTEDVGAEAKPLIKVALAQVEWATGMKFRYVGKTKLIPYNMKTRKRYPRDTDLVIAFATHAEVPDFVRRTAAGFGGPRWLFPARNSKGQRVWRTDEAGVTLSTDYWYDGFAHNFFDNIRATIGELILHEVGHAVGLDHVPAAAEEIMNGRGYYRYPDGFYKGLFNAGDLNGLSKVGLKQGCLRPIGRGGRVAPVPVETLPLP